MFFKNIKFWALMAALFVSLMLVLNPESVQAQEPAPQANGIQPSGQAEKTVQPDAKNAAKQNNGSLSQPTVGSSPKPSVGQQASETNKSQTVASASSKREA